ncbi:MAG: hypothetical protein HLUCCO16_00340 [Phormidium sp. OSCR]|nr:MAG: hypothetical protein HLUCCO16_00340 [Phormidium sp. OSCR]
MKHDSIVSLISVLPKWLKSSFGLGTLGLGLTVVALQSPAAIAQNLGANPLYGTIDLTAGFTPDPYPVDVMPGGSTNASNLDLGSDCVGFINASNPDVRVNYQAGNFSFLSFAVSGGGDTTLLINGPDGNWYCNDDFAGSVSPKVMFEPAQSGEYDIWVGTFGEDSGGGAQLQISEMQN